jgi:hypothetical protein
MTGSAHHKPKLVTDRERKGARKGRRDYIPAAFVKLDRLLKGKRGPRKSGNGTVEYKREP